MSRDDFFERVVDDPASALVSVLDDVLSDECERRRYAVFAGAMLVLAAARSRGVIEDPKRAVEVSLRTLAIVEEHEWPRSRAAAKKEET